MINSHAAQIVLARFYKFHLVKFKTFLSKTFEFPMRGPHFCNAGPLDNHHCWAFRGHACWVEFARHSKESLSIELYPLACEPHPHLFLQNRTFSFGVVAVGAPGPLATVTFPMCQIQVRRLRALTRACYRTKQF